MRAMTQPETCPCCQGTTWKDYANQCAGCGMTREVARDGWKPGMPHPARCISCGGDLRGDLGRWSEPVTAGSRTVTVRFCSECHGMGEPNDYKNGNTKHRCLNDCPDPGSEVPCKLYRDHTIWHSNGRVEWDDPDELGHIVYQPVSHPPPKRRGAGRFDQWRGDIVRAVTDPGVDGGSPYSSGGRQADAELPGWLSESPRFTDEDMGLPSQLPDECDHEHPLLSCPQCKDRREWTPFYLLNGSDVLPIR